METVKQIHHDLGMDCHVDKIFLEKIFEKNFIAAMFLEIQLPEA